MTHASPPVACTLDAISLRHRLEWLRDLHDRALLRYDRDGPALRLSFAAAAKDDVLALIRHEQGCCAFLCFELVEGEQEVHLTVTVPSEASEIADEILGYFAPVRGGTGKVGRSRA